MGSKKQYGQPATHFRLSEFYPPGRLSLHNKLVSAYQTLHLKLAKKRSVTDINMRAELYSILINEDAQNNKAKQQNNKAKQQNKPKRKKEKMGCYLPGFTGHYLL